MGFGVVPETVEEFERQFGRERVAIAATECGIPTTNPQNRLTDDQRRVLFQRLVGVSANAPVRSAVANSSTVSSASAVSADTNRLLRQIQEERVARANVEQALRVQRSTAEALRNQIEQRGSELERMADAERQLRQEITSLSARLQSLQRTADENKELRSELKSQEAVVAACSRHQVAEARDDLLRAEIKALRRGAEKAEKLHFEGIRQRTQIAELKSKIDALKAKLRAAKSDRSRRPAATKPSSQLDVANRRIVGLEKKLGGITNAGNVEASASLDLLLDSCIQVWARKQGRSGRKLVLPECVTVSGYAPLSAGALEALLVTRGIGIVPISDPRAEILIVGRDGWMIDDIEDQIKVRAGKELFIYSQEMFLTALLVGADPFRPCDRKVLLQFAVGHEALQYCRSEGFNWPQIDTTSIAKALANPWDDRVGESPLKKLGYTVGVSKGLAQDKRHEILEEAFEGLLPDVDSKSYMATWGKPGTRRRLRRIARFLAWQKRNAQKRDADMRQAIAEWSSDLDWLSGFYQPWMRFRWPSTHVDGPDTPVRRRSGTRKSSTKYTGRRTASSTPNYRRVLRMK